MVKRRTAALAGLALGLAVGTAQRRARAVRARNRARLSGDHGRSLTVTMDDGVRIAVDVEDHPRPEVAVVFAHGWMMDHRCWHPQREALAGRAAMLVFYDQRGHGASSAGALDAYTIDRLGDDLAAVIAAVVPDGLPIVLVGHSMGGMTIMALAARHPELVASRVAGVALLSTSSGQLADSGFGLPRPLARFVPRVAPVVFDHLLARAPVIDNRPRLKTRTNLPVARYVAFGRRAKRDHVWFVSTMASATPTEVMVGFYRDFMIHDKQAALAALRTVETLVMVGEHDRLTPPAHSRRMAGALPAARLVTVPGAGHMIGFERPDLVNHELAALLDRARAAAAARPSRERPAAASDQ